MVQRCIVCNAQRQEKSVEKQDECLTERLSEKKADDSERTAEILSFLEKSEV